MTMNLSRYTRMVGKLRRLVREGRFCGRVFGGPRDGEVLL